MNPSDQSVPVLYSFRRCPYAMRARLALAVSETAVELREIKLSAKPDTMLEASPKGTVPVLVLHDGTVIDQSLEIMRFALKQHDPEGWLERSDPELISRNDGPFKQDLDRYKYPSRHGSNPAEHRAKGLDFLETLEARLTAQSFLGGDTRSLTDAAIAPFIRQFAAVEPEWFSALPLPRLQAWLGEIVESALFARIMLRPPPWQAGDEPLLTDWSTH